MQVTEGDADPVRGAGARRRRRSRCRDLRAVPASALSADPETGELAAPLGSVQLLADSVLALARALGGRSVATATFATRDPELPLTRRRARGRAGRARHRRAASSRCRSEASGACARA